MMAEPSSSSGARSSRINFPHDPSGPATTPPRIASLLPKVSPPRRGSPLNPHHMASSSLRHRILHVDSSDVFLESPSEKRASGTSRSSPLRLSSGGNQFLGDSTLSGAFSDEYDLSHEDPRILQDVQRAMRLKARREARLRAGQLSPESFKSDTIPRSSNSSSPPLDQPPLDAVISQTNMVNASDVDFSPSTAVVNPAYAAHPVPSSSDYGKTLDWGESSDKGMRWALSIHKRKGKEKETTIGLNLEQEAKVHEAKLIQLRAIMSPQTKRKASIVQNQLGRRYRLLDALLLSGSNLNMAHVARWRSTLEPVLTISLEKAEPFAWLKHLDKGGTKRLHRPPWYFTALIVEEFLHSITRHDMMETIPEDSDLNNLSPKLLLPPNPQSLTPSRTSSRYSSSPSTSHRLSTEDSLSFEPIVGPSYSLLDRDAESRESGESGLSSLASGESHPALSNNVSQVPTHTPDQVAQRVPQDSDISPSVGQSPLDPLDRIATINVKVTSLDEMQNGSNKPKLIPIVPKLMVDDKSLSIPSASVGKLSGSNPDLPQSAISRFSGHIPQLPPRREPKLRRAQTSLPPIGRSSSGAQGRLQWEADEEKLNREYEAKTALLNESLTQNQRIRQLLNRISADVRDYETVQSEAMKSFHTPHDSLPRELLEAFSHDPAAVTGATRRGTGYMVVDDIHNRLVRQREIFQEFLKQVGKSEHGFKGVLGDPIVALVQCLRELEAQRESVCKKAQNVGAKLATVQGVHSLTKDEYNMALSHVSVVYPELSHIIALEESYKDQYQQFWEFGMDALTFLLDTITPFWRTYGKTIGEDTRDFLIIPLYRNEFTGEAKRYHIQHFPKRSFRHWLGLILFFLSSVTVMVLQGRAAVSSSSHYKLRWITYESVRWTAIPFFWVGILIQWWAVLTEFAIVFLQLGVIVWWVGWSVRLFN